MEQSQSKGIRMVFVLAVSATLFAIATFLALALLVNRPEPPQPVASPPPQQVLVDGLLINLQTDPEKAIYLAGEGVPITLPEDQGQEGQLVPVVPPPTAVPPTPTPPPPTPVPEPVIFIEYIVREGDSLYGIAEQQNSSIELMALNGIDDTNLVPGTALNLPVANPNYCPGGRAYVVRDKDTAFRIAQQFGTTVDTLRSLNNLDESFAVRVTQVICVP